MRIVVSGTRGKSTLVRMLSFVLSIKHSVLSKVTGEKAVIIRDGSEIPIHRRPRQRILENLPLLSEKVDFLILENQTITPHTMRVFNRMVRPDVVVITNVRRDHTEFLGEKKEHIADCFGRSIQRGARMVLSGEHDDRLNEIIRRHAERMGAEFRVVRSSGDLPASELLSLTEFLSEYLLGYVPEERVRLLEKSLERMFSIRESKGVRFFDGSKINDPDSADLVIRHLVKRYNDRFLLFCQFRRDRRDRTSVFCDFLLRLPSRDRFRGIMLAGHGAEAVAGKVGGEIVRSACEVFEKVRSENATLLMLVNRHAHPMSELVEILGSSSALQLVSV